MRDVRNFICVVDEFRSIGESRGVDAQEQAAGHLGDSVMVNGTLQGNTIHVASIEKLTSIWFGSGPQGAYFFGDQFGREQNLDTLKGPKGSVLLFFRSADW